MGTGQYDYNIYQTLLRIETLLESMFEFFEPWNEFFSNISSTVSSMITYVQSASGSLGGQNSVFFPLIVSCLISLLIISITKWLVKL